MKQTNKRKEKKFDAVKMMRDIRDKISREMMNMNHEEQLAYIQNRLAEAPVKKAA